jgi:hypothetical protein
MSAYYKRMSLLFVASSLIVLAGEGVRTNSIDCDYYWVNRRVEDRLYVFLVLLLAGE